MAEYQQSRRQTIELLCLVLEELVNHPSFNVLSRERSMRTIFPLSRTLSDRQVVFSVPLPISDNLQIPVMSIELLWLLLRARSFEVLHFEDSNGHMDLNLLSRRRNSSLSMQSSTRLAIEILHFLVIAVSILLSSKICL